MEEPPIDLDLEFPELPSPLEDGRSTPPKGYWYESRQPLASLVFIAPWLAVYEGGVLLLGPRALRNAADVWLRQLLDLLSFGQYFLLPLLTVCLLLGWHHLSRAPWRVSRRVLAGMAVESLVLAWALVVVSWVPSLVADGGDSGIGGGATVMLAAADGRGLFERIVGYIGAGIYEELLFRLLLLSGLAALLDAAGMGRGWALFTAAVVTSLLFSAAHYVGAYGDDFELASFTFRFAAGALFAGVFVYRGFGIAAGAHAAYDVFVGIFL